MTGSPARSVQAPFAALAGRTAGGGAPSPAVRAAADPCLTCSLPDCDEHSARCALKVAWRAYRQALARGPVPEDIQATARFARRARWIDWLATRAEGA